MDKFEYKPKDKPLVIPEPSRPDLAEFLERLWADEANYPQVLEVRQAYGPGARKYGATVIQHPIKPNAKRPTREEIVALSNRFIDDAQNNCNAVGKPHRYGILAKNHIKAADYYAVFVIALKPTQAAEYDPNAQEDDEDIVSDSKRRDSFLSHTLEHLKASDENERWRQDQHSQATGDLLTKYAELASILVAQNMSLMQEHRELFKTADEALSKKTEREILQEKERFKQTLMIDAFSFLKACVPVAIARIEGKAPQKGEESSESLAVKAFLEGLTEDQAKVLFGNITNGQLVGDGIFRREQVEVFAGVAELRLPASELERLISGDLGISPEQISAVQSHCTMKQLQPLMAVVMARK